MTINGFRIMVMAAVVTRWPSILIVMIMRRYYSCSERRRLWLGACRVVLKRRRPSGAKKAKPCGYGSRAATARAATRSGAFATISLPSLFRPKKGDHSFTRPPPDIGG